MQLAELTDSGSTRIHIRLAERISLFQSAVIRLTVFDDRRTKCKGEHNVVGAVLLDVFAKLVILPDLEIAVVVDHEHIEIFLPRMGASFVTDQSAVLNDNAVFPEFVEIVGHSHHAVGAGENVGRILIAGGIVVAVCPLSAELGGMLDFYIRKADLRQTDFALFPPAGDLYGAVLIAGFAAFGVEVVGIGRILRRAEVIGEHADDLSVCGLCDNGIDFVIDKGGYKVFGHVDLFDVGSGRKRANIQ